MSERGCSDVCETLMEYMCGGNHGHAKCKYHSACIINDVDDGGMAEGQTHDQMIECIAHGYTPPNKPWLDKDAKYIGLLDLSLVKEHVIGKLPSEIPWVRWEHPGMRSIFAPVIDLEGRIVDIFHALGSYPTGRGTVTFFKAKPVKWDGYAGAYRLADERAEG